MESLFSEPCHQFSQQHCQFSSQYEPLNSTTVLSCNHVFPPGSEKVFKADLVLLAMGFVGPERQIVEELSVNLDQRGNLSTPNSKYNTSIPRLYAAGGMYICLESVSLLWKRSFDTGTAVAFLRLCSTGSLYICSLFRQGCI